MKKFRTISQNQYGFLAEKYGQITGPNQSRVTIPLIGVATRDQSGYASIGLNR